MKSIPTKQARRKNTLILPSTLKAGQYILYATRDWYYCGKVVEPNLEPTIYGQPIGASIYISHGDNIKLRHLNDAEAKYLNIQLLPKPNHC